MTPDMVIFYVSDVARSAEFYAKIFGQDPVELSPGFGLFVLSNGFKFGIWKREAVQPATEFSGAGSEFILHAGDDAGVKKAHAEWAASGYEVLDPPTRREFGYSFVMADPDGQRVRILKAEG